jgi:hypothetical protein
MVEEVAMQPFIQPTFVLLLFLLVRSADLAITSAISHSVIRAIAYGVVSLLALIAVLVSLGLP